MLRVEKAVGTSSPYSLTLEITITAMNLEELQCKKIRSTVGSFRELHYSTTTAHTAVRTATARTSTSTTALQLYRYTTGTSTLQQSEL